MEHGYLVGDPACESFLASGDASKPMPLLHMSDSLLDLLPDPNTDTQDNFDLEQRRSPGRSPERSPERSDSQESSYPPSLTESALQRSFSTSRLHRRQTHAVVAEGRENTWQCGVQPRISRSNCNLQKSKPTIPLQNIARILACDVCRAVPITALSVHTCKNGHQVCGDCFGNGLRNCNQCDSPLEGRNEVLENVLQRLRQVCPALFPLNDWWSAHDSSNIVHPCHKPLFCPHLVCKRVVASNGFYAHFRFEHSKVPRFHMSPGCSYNFNIPFRSLQDSLSRALCIFMVQIGANLTGCQPIKPEYEDDFLFSDRRDSVVCTLMTGSVQVGANTMLAVWCASLYEGRTPLVYCLHARTTLGTESAFSGHMMSLHSSQNPLRILCEGQCLILAPGGYQQDTLNTTFATISVSFLCDSTNPQ